MNNDKRYSLNLDLSADKELNDAIDAMIRERCTQIIRQELDEYIRQIVMETVDPERIESAMRDAVNRSVNGHWRAFNVGEYLKSDDELAKKLFNQVQYSMASAYETQMRRYIESRMAGVVQGNVIAAVVDAVTKSNKRDDSYAHAL